MRFPIKEMVKVTGISKSTVSKFYNGIVPISDNFFEKFKEGYKNDFEKIQRQEKAISSEKSKFDNDDAATRISGYLELEFDELKQKVSTIEKSIERLEQKLDKLLGAGAEKLSSQGDGQKEPTPQK